MLRPAGRLAVFRSDPEPPPDLADAFASARRRVLPESLGARLSAGPPADGASTLAAKAADGMRRAGAFGEPEQWRFDWERAYTRAEWLDQLPTQGFYTRLASHELEQVLADVGAAIDRAGGRFTMRYTTTVVTAARVAGAL